MTPKEEKRNLFNKMQSGRQSRTLGKAKPPGVMRGRVPLEDDKPAEPQNRNDGYR